MDTLSLVSGLGKLTICIALLLEALQQTCPHVCFSVEEPNEYGLFVCFKHMYMFCARHCNNVRHQCLLVSIGDTLVPNNDPETTHDYIKRVVELVEKQLNMHSLMKLFEAVLPFKTLCVVVSEKKFKIKHDDLTLNTSEGTIQGGSLVNCGIPLKPDGQPNLPLIILFLKIFELPGEAVYIKIISTANGFIGLHVHLGKNFISLSNNKGEATTIDLSSISLLKIENFLNSPDDDLAVIHTTGTLFSGVVGHLEFSFANVAIIKVGNEMHCIPTRQWTSLKQVFELF
jgi:hypothetical protein